MSYAFHNQQWWLDRAIAGDAPLWLRVAFLGYSHHTANGHATFDEGEISRLLGVDGETGESAAVRKDSISWGIKKAVTNGYLAQGSGAHCLVMPYPGIWQGPGEDDAPCPVHAKAGTAAQRAARAIRSDPNHAHKVIQRERFLRLQAQRGAHDEVMDAQKGLRVGRSGQLSTL